MLSFAIVKMPPTYKSVPEIASAITSLLSPKPSADQPLPFHLAMWLAGVPPVVVKSPPAYKSLPETIKAETVPPNPASSADQFLPSHFATRLAQTRDPSLL